MFFEKTETVFPQLDKQHLNVSGLLWPAVFQAFIMCVLAA